MLWSQIKLTSYDFSDLHITGKYDIQPGTGRFSRIFSYVVTYRTGAGRRLYMITSADARPDIVRCPAGVVRDQPDTVRCPAELTRMKQNFKCNDVYINIKICHHSSKETGWSNKKDWDWLWQWWKWKPQDSKKIALVRCICFILSCSSEIYILYL